MHNWNKYFEIISPAEELNILFQAALPYNTARAKTSIYLVKQYTFAQSPTPYPPWPAGPIIREHEHTLIRSSVCFNLLEQHYYNNTV